MLEKLQKISDEIQLLSNQGSHAPKAAERIVELSESALEIMKERLGVENRAVESLIEALRKLELGIYDGHSFFQFSIIADSAVEDAIGDLRRAAKPKVVRTPTVKERTPASEYVAAQRLSDIKSLTDSNWDFTKLYL